MCPHDEMREAIRWQIGDLIDYPPEEAVVDVFHDPVAAVNEQKAKGSLMWWRPTRNQVAERVAWMRECPAQNKGDRHPRACIVLISSTMFPDTGRGVGLLCISTTTPV